MAPIIYTKQDIVDRCEARYAKAQYRETHALLINWEDDDLKAKSDTRGLEFVLRVSYAVVTRLITLPSRDYMEENLSTFEGSAGRTFRRELDEFIRLYSAPDILLLVIYLGRGHYDEDLLFTLRGFGKPMSKLTRKVMPKLRWSVAESGLLEAESDVVMLFDLRGDEGDSEPVCMFDTSDIARQESINKLAISYSAPGTPGDTGKSFAYTKLLRDYLRTMATPSPFVMFGPAHSACVKQIHDAHDHGGLVFPPFCHSFSSTQAEDIPLISFDLTYPSVNLLKGVGDYKWGPLGRLPAGCEKNIDNNDPYWRPYFKDPTGLNHSTRGWVTACKDPDEVWDATKFARAGEDKVYARFMATKKPQQNLPERKRDSMYTASEDFASWAVGATLRQKARADREQKELRVREEAAYQEAVRESLIEEVLREEVEEKARLETLREEAFTRAQQESAETDRLNALREQALSISRHQEATLQQALELAAHQGNAEKQQEGVFQKEQEEQYDRQRSEAARRLETNNRMGGITGLSISRYASAQNMNIPVLGRGPTKFEAVVENVPQLGGHFVALRDNPQLSDYFVPSQKVEIQKVEVQKVKVQKVEVQQVKVQPVEILTSQTKIEAPVVKLEAVQVKVQVQQLKTETLKSTGMSAWQAYLAQSRR